MSRLKRKPTSPADRKMPDKAALKLEAVPLLEPPRAAPVRTWPYVLALLLLPVIVLWRQDNALFTGVGYLDPWFYLGFFRNLANFKGAAFPFTYYGSRLSWILPGALIHSLYSPVIANCVLHLAVQSVATVSLFTTLRLAAGARRAFLTTMVCAVNPWLWNATGWDCVDGAGIAYCLLTMALLTSAAVRPVKRWTLLAAGMSLAALIYTNLFWVALAPLLPLGYIALAWMWRRTPVIRSFLSLCLWFGAGCVILTGAFGGINWMLDGHFWFYAPSVLAGLGLMNLNYVWFQSIWINHVLAPWLWFGVIAGSAGLVLLPYRLRRPLTGTNAAGLLFVAQFLLALGFMEYMQDRGRQSLGFPFYASYMLPFSFLVIGTSFWPAAGKISQVRYALICCMAAILFGAVWYDYAGTILPIWPAAIRQTVLVGGCLLASGLVLRRRTVGILLSIAGFAVITSYAWFHMPGDPHAYRRQYEALMHARERIESIRNGGYVRFWYDAHDSAVRDYDALSATYLWSNSLWGDRFPEPPRDVDIPPGTLFVVLSSHGNDSELARKTLSQCWEPYGMRAALVENDIIDHSSYRYTMTLLTAEVDPARWRPLQVVFDPNGKGHLQPVEGSAAPLAFPLDFWSWVNEQYGQRVAGGVKVRTPRALNTLAAMYPALVAPASGRYRFSLRYKLVNGVPGFGASIGDGSPWLTLSIGGHQAENDREVDFWVDLRSGQEIHLGIMNGAEGPPASFLMKAVTAVEVLDSKAEIRESPPRPRAVRR
jgi:hypothetical protein